MFSDIITTSTKETWIRFVDEVEPYRQDMFRYGLKLTGNPFDAEDLVHDAMLKAFGSMATHVEPISSPRGFLLRITSNLWIDAVRRSQLCALTEVESVENADEGQLTEAVAHLVSQVNPREQVIVVLIEVFEMTHKEVAKVLSTTEGAVKVALHRTRAKLKQTRLSPRAPKALVEEFIQIFQTHDVNAIKILLGPDFEADVFPYTPDKSGRDHHAEKGWLNGCLYHHVAQREAAKDAYPLYLEVVELWGEFVVLVCRDHGEGQKLEEVWRFEADDDQLIRVWDYGFSPELVNHVAKTLNLPFNKVGYRLHKHSYE